MGGGLAIDPPAAVAIDLQPGMAEAPDADCPVIRALRVVQVSSSSIA